MAAKEFSSRVKNVEAVAVDDFRLVEPRSTVKVRKGSYGGVVQKSKKKRLGSALVSFPLL